MSSDNIFVIIKDILVQEFDIDPAVVIPEALLVEDLDLDSIDAVDLIVKLQDYTTARIDPGQFKNVKTLQDVVDIIFPLVKVPS